MESNKFESIYSQKVKAGRRRTYFFDVRKTKGEDYYITLTESTRKYNDSGYERHKIFLYKEDFNRFVEGLQDVVDHVKNELMPDYDYDEFAKRYEEDAEDGVNFGKSNAPAQSIDQPNTGQELSSNTEDVSKSADTEDEDEMSW